MSKKAKSLLKFVAIQFDEFFLLFIFKLIYMGRDYPKEPEVFKIKCHAAFKKNKDIEDPEKIEQLLGHGNYIVKELEALYMLKKYRTLKRRYYDSDDAINKKLEEMQKVIRDA